MIAFTYLAAPYTPLGEHAPERAACLRHERYLACCRAAAKLMREGRVVFSPISHSHDIDRCFDAPESGEFWKRQDEPYLTLCAEMVVLMLPGWEASRGVQHEVEVAQFRGIRISYMEAV